MYRFYVNDPVRFQKSIRMTLEHGHANNVSNDYSSTAFWYQTEPHKPFRPLPPAAERHPNAGSDPHDLAWQRLAAMRGKALQVFIQNIFNKIPLPEDMQYDIKEGIHQAYYNREYARVLELADSLEARMDAWLAEHVPPAEPQESAEEN